MYIPWVLYPFFGHWTSGFLVYSQITRPLTLTSGSSPSLHHLMMTEAGTQCLPGVGARRGEWAGSHPLQGHFWDLGVVSEVLAGHIIWGSAFPGTLWPQSAGPLFSYWSRSKTRATGGSSAASIRTEEIGRASCRERV